MDEPETTLSTTTMPQMSKRTNLRLLSDLDRLELKVLTARIANLKRRLEESSEDEYDSDEEDIDLMVITPPSPITPIISGFSDSTVSTYTKEIQYHELLGIIRALRDEVEQSRVSNH